jgi:hypothetical protein
MEITADAFNKLLNNKNIIVQQFRDHGKASERYVDVKITQEDGFTWEGFIPYSYRRTGLAIETPDKLVEYLNEIYPFFSKQSISEFEIVERKRWEDEMAGKQTTKEFFDKLLNLEWNSASYDLPANTNFARRIQDIKEFGYTLATDTKRKVKGKQENGTHILLVPIPKGGSTGYEVMSPIFKAKAIAVLGALNIYELSRANKHGLLPDHKFPEIRWDEATRAENPDNMPDAEIRVKFQLLDNQRNQHKREVCRNCFQTDMRGKLYGIDFFYQGGEKWPANVPKTGKAAEKGCVGCGWYDIEKWRETLNSTF